MQELRESVNRLMLMCPKISKKLNYKELKHKVTTRYKDLLQVCYSLQNYFTVPVAAISMEEFQHNTF